jgi:hypothetical protein
VGRREKTRCLEKEIEEALRVLHKRSGYADCPYLRNLPLWIVCGN